ncbi:MAG: endospore germination permease [Eubacteriales bacterium]
MSKKPVITSLQLLMMAVGSALVFPYTFMPILDSQPGNQDVWIVLFLGFVYVLIINAPMLYLMNKFRGISINDTFDITFGKALGKIAIIPFVLFFLYCYIACIVIIAMFINIYLFPDTPTWGLLIYVVVPVIYASYKGAGTIGRLAFFLVPFTIITIVLFFIFGFKLMDFNVLQPILADSTFLQLNWGAFLTAARYSEILIFFVFSYYLTEKSSINKTYASALTVFAVCFFLMLLPTILVLGVEYAKHSWNPYYSFTSQIEALGFLERMQSINILAWFPISLLKLTMYNYMASTVFADLVKVKSHRYFVAPLAIVGAIISLLPIINNENTVSLLQSDQVFPWVIFPVTFIIPLISLIVYLIRRKKINTIIKQRTEPKELTSNNN